MVGALGEFTVNFQLNGNPFLGSDPPHSSVYVRVFVRVADSYRADTRFASGTMYNRANDGSLQTLPMDGALIGPGVYAMKFRIHFGRAASLTAWLESEADARAHVNLVAQGARFGQATSDFRPSLTWTGIAEVRVADGPLLDDVSIASDSGFDYRRGGTLTPCSSLKSKFCRKAWR